LASLNVDDEGRFHLGRCRDVLKANFFELYKDAHGKPHRDEAWRGYIQLPDWANAAELEFVMQQMKGLKQPKPFLIVERTQTQACITLYDRANSWLAPVSSSCYTNDPGMLMDSVRRQCCVMVKSWKDELTLAADYCIEIELLVGIEGVTQKPKHSIASQRSNA